MKKYFIIVFWKALEVSYKSFFALTLCISCKYIHRREFNAILYIVKVSSRREALVSPDSARYDAMRWQTREILASCSNPRSNEHLQLLFPRQARKHSTITMRYVLSTWRVLLRARTSLEEALSLFLPGAHEIHNAAMYHPTVIVLGCMCMSVCMCVCACWTRETTQANSSSVRLRRRLVCMFIFSLAFSLSFFLSLSLSSHFRIYSNSRVWRDRRLK